MGLPLDAVLRGGQPPFRYTLEASSDKPELEAKAYVGQSLGRGEGSEIFTDVYGGCACSFTGTARAPWWREAERS